MSAATASQTTLERSCSPVKLVSTAPQFRYGWSSILSTACMHAHTYTHAHHMHACRHMHACTHTYMCMSTRVHGGTDMNMNSHLQVCGELGVMVHQELPDQHEAPVIHSSISRCCRSPAPFIWIVASVFPSGPLCVCLYVRLNRSSRSVCACNRASVRLSIRPFVRVPIQSLCPRPSTCIHSVP